MIFQDDVIRIVLCDYIYKICDTERVKAVCDTALKKLDEKGNHDVKDSNYFWIERTENSTIEETVRKAERHFGLVEKSIT